MSRRTKQPATAVSLFPFLAVLVCAMGALIFLLLVITRLIRDEVRSEAQAPVPNAPAPVVEAIVSQRSEPHRPAALAPLPKPPASQRRPLLPTFAPDPVPDPFIAQQAELHAQWSAGLSQLRAAAEQAAATIAAREATLSQALAAAREEHRALEALRSRQQTLELAQNTQQATFERLQRQQSTVKSQLTDVGRKIENAQTEVLSASSKYSIIPYDGQSGATRRPIIIECTDRGLTFVSEQITLRPSDVDGFTERFNPLLAGSNALIDYWSQRASAGEPRPYVLLVIRPKGTVAYYIARQLLEKLEEPFGYELVTDDQQFQWPDTEAGAVAACKNAIEKLLRDRNQLREAVAGARVPNAPKFQGAQGDFSLPEVERLKHSGREVTFGGRQWSREPEAPTSSFPSTGRGAHTDNVGQPDSVHEQDEDFTLGRSHVRKEPIPQEMPESETGALSGMPTLEEGEPRLPPRLLPSTLRNSPEESDATLDHAESLQQVPAAAPHAGKADMGELFARARQPSADHLSEPPSPANMLELKRDQRPGRKTPINPESPQWGIRTPGGSIGFEREILVRVTSGEVRIADESSFPIESGAAADELRKRLAVHLDAHVTSWGPPPQNFYWVPAVRFVVSPGGNQYQRRLETLVKQWGLRSRVEYALE